ncbi:2-dehydropantoate 2-reductase [Reyranella sp.]|uniref:2-dehydropantoate 2-reductase n=1 Tax=Reyranella sp. TaxID=1929291 RepID=UPI002F95B28F
MTSICVFGAGAIGGLIAAKLESAGTPVTVVARGPHCEAMRANGLALRSDGREVVTRPRVETDPRSVGAQDYLMLTLKAHSLVPAMAQLKPLIGPDTTIVAAINGVPWWYTYRLGGAFEGRRVEAVDPDGVVSAGLPPAQALGCIVYPAADVVEPGMIHHTYGDRFTLGEPDGSRSDRAAKFSELLIKAGLKAPVRARIRDELWVKLWGNMAFNPVSALTGATLDKVLADPGTHAVCRALMVEGQAVAEKLGVRFAIGVDKRLAGGAEVGAHKTSMLQDLERGRPLEIEALLGAVVEMAGWVGVDMPIGRSILALVRQRAEVR